MASSDFERVPTGVRATLAGARESWNRFWRKMSFYLPKRLYARSLLIVVMPMILLQSVVAYIYMDRYWRAGTERASTRPPQATIATSSKSRATVLSLMSTCFRRSHCRHRAPSPFSMC